MFIKAVYFILNQTTKCFLKVSDCQRIANIHCLSRKYLKNVK